MAVTQNIEKNITVVMEQATNEGYGYHTKEGVEVWGVLNDHIGYPVFLDKNGQGLIPTSNTPQTNNRIIGILQESFSRAHVAHRVCNRGRVVMRAHEGIAIGNCVGWYFKSGNHVGGLTKVDVSDAGVTPKTPPTDYDSHLYIGVVEAIDSTGDDKTITKEGDMVSVYVNFN